MVAEFTKAENVPLLILSILVVAANTVICVLVIARSSLRTYTNGFVCSLAVSDILIGGVLLPANVAGVDQVIQSYIVSISLLAGVANVTTVTLDRYIAVLRPLHYQTIMQKYYIKLLVTSWALAIGISILPLIWFPSTSLIIYQVYILCVQILFVILPYCLVFIGYYRIFKEVRQTVLEEKRLTASLNVNIPDSQAHTKRVSFSSERKIAKLSIIVASTFLLTWLPVEYLTLMSYIGQWSLIPKQMPIISRYTIALGALVDPMVYSFLKPDFRKAFWDIIAKRLLKRARPRAESNNLSGRREQSDSSAVHIFSL